MFVTINIQVSNHLPADPSAAHARTRPDAVAIVFEGDVWTWSRIEDAIQRASGFLDAHVPAGGAVLLQGWNHPHFIVLREAVYRTGRTFGAVSPTATEIDIAHIFRITGCSLFLRSPTLAPTSAPSISWDDPLSAAPKEVPDRRAGAQTLLLTSGTTGLSKACIRPVAADTVRMESMVRTFGLSANQNHLVATPLYHSGPSIFQRTHWALGSTTYLDAKFDPAAVWRHTAEGHAATAFFVPTHYYRLLRDNSKTASDSVQTWWIAGAPASRELKENVIARIGPGKLWEFLGSSETGTVTVMPPDGHAKKPGSVGRPPANVEIRILDDAGCPLPAGEIGLIYVRSGMLMSGYLGADAPAALWKDGFLSVGDLGWVDADGYLFLSDRRTDLIISGGVNVYPAEVEAALLAFPGVREAAVVGEPDAEWGARVVAVIAGDDSVSIEALNKFLRERLATAKRPRRIERWPVLPHNAIGKPLRGEVRRIVSENRGEGAPPTTSIKAQ
jgi:long-chain acyl-CoA synthetase